VMLCAAQCCTTPADQLVGSRAIHAGSAPPSRAIVEARSISVGETWRDRTARSSLLPAARQCADRVRPRHRPDPGA
jgi:hypothetical protein